MGWAPDVRFNIRADATGAIQSINQVNSKLMQIDGQTAKVTQSTNLYSKASGGLSNQMKGLALRFVGYNMILNQVMNMQQKVIQGIEESVDAYRELQLRMAEISTIISTEELPMMEELTQGVQAMSQAYGKSSSDVAKGLYDILSAAFSTGDALMLLNTATRAAIAGLSDIRTSVDIFTTVLNAYGMRVYQAAKVSDVLFQSVIRGKFQFEDLESALGYLVPIAAQVGVSFDEMMAALSTATRFGLHVDMASRGLAMAIQGIINPSKEAADAAEKYGVEMNGLSLQVLGLYGWFDQLNEAVGEFGTHILSEIIPNIRSLRVAMVLAGDEGLAGFAEDLKYLAEMGDLTDTALERIMDTSSFVSSQMAQEMEQLKRDVGEDWDSMVMGIQRGILDIVGLVTGKNYESHVADIFKLSSNDMTNMDNYMKVLKGKKKTEEELIKAREEKKTVSLEAQSFTKANFEVNEQNKRLKELDKTINEHVIDLQEWIDKEGELAPSIQKVIGSIIDQTDIIGKLKIDLMDITNDVTKFTDELVTPKISGWGNALKTSSVNISEFTSLTDKQKEAIQRLGGTIQGTMGYEYDLLKASQLNADISHDVEMGLKTENYNYKAIPDNIRAAIDATREYTEAQKRNKEATEQMSAVLRILQIEQLEIQLKGMIRRRGLTHAEERRMKQIQIEEAKIRLANMKAEEEQTVEAVVNSQERQNIIDKYLAKIQEEEYILKYNYDQQIKDLENSIGTEAIHLTTRYDYWKTTNQKIIDNTTNLMLEIEGLLSQDFTGAFKQQMEDAGLIVPELLTSLGKIKGVAQNEFGNYEGGTTTATPKVNVTYDHPTLKEARGKQYSTLDAALRIWGIPPKMHTGTSYVPATRPYMLEKGETVTSKNAIGDETSQNNVTIHINNPIIKDDYDLAKVARTLENVERASFTNKQTGRNKYRMA